MNHTVSSVRPIQSERSEPGIAIRVLRTEKTLSTELSGAADIESGRPFTENTPVHIASHTKTFCAYTVLSALAERNLSPFTPISTCLSGLPASWDRISFHHCLSYTTGLAYDEQLAWLCGRDWRTPTVEDYLFQLLCSVEPLHPPGDVFLYNDSGFRLAVRAIEAVCGQPFEALLLKHVCQPAGLIHTHLSRHGARALPGKASTYWNDGGVYSRHVAYMQLSGDGGIVSSLHDMTHWARFLLHKARTACKIVSSMCTAPELRSGELSRYGLGVHLGHHRGRDWFGHAGGGAGYSMVWLCPDADLAIIVLAARSDIDPLSLALGVSDAYLDQALPATARARHASSQSAPRMHAFIDPETGISAEIDWRDDVIKLETLGDFAFLERDGGESWSTRDGRLNARWQELPKPRLNVDGLDLHLSPTRWHPCDAAAFDMIIGTYLCRPLMAFLDIKSRGGHLWAYFAGGPDASWCHAVERSDRAGCYRAGPYTLRHSGEANSLLIRGRGIPALAYEKVGR
jgi:CubicO group peptidase (beta-lactamase class C family)